MRRRALPPDSRAPGPEQRGKIAGVRLGAVAIVAVAFAPVARSAPPAYERPPINYSHAKPRDAVARLLQRIAAGEVVLTGSDQEILRALLRELGIPVESQILVFSKTSLQSGLIAPESPRALYFSDSVYVGWVPGGLIEAAAIDPELGPVFYAFDPQDARDARRSLVRETTCLRCHGETFSREIPGLIERSVVVSDRGELLPGQGEELVDDATPFERRWGGWYVTGYGGRQSHLGNAFGVARDGQIEFSPSLERPLELSHRFDTSRYLTTTSDVVALLVFQHQLAMHNSLTRAAQRCRRALDSQRVAQIAANEPLTAAPASENARNVYDTAAADVVDHLLFRGAAPLPNGVAGTDGFRRAFAAGAPRSAKGDTLKDLSAHGRLFANRCSFLIYSESFGALPPALQDRIFSRLAAALRGGDVSGRFAYLEKDERRRIVEVLTETVPQAARYF